VTELVCSTVHKNCCALPGCSCDSKELVAWSLWANRFHL